MSTITASDSLEAVPFPREIRLTLYFLIMSRTIFFDSATLFCGAVGKITVVYNTFPVLSTTASLHPVLNAGSQPKTFLPAIGGCISNCLRFCPNTVIAPSSAFSVSWLLISLSIAGFIRRLKPSSIASFNSGLNWDSPFIITLSKDAIIFSSGISIFTFNTFSFSPLLMARILCPGILFTPSL